ncbi:MAG: FHA domain-containing protein [Chloroflexi bacterium]|nr:FHA domain-containing protein [Chloroflexota bacterium]
MTTDAVLFILRLLAGVILLAVLAILFLVMWRDYKSALIHVESSRRAYGRLVAVEELDGVQIAGQVYALLPLTSIGRSPTNTITIDDDFASGEHALVAYRGGQWWLEDRQSRNGTTINDIPVKQPIIITDGDVIGIGSCRFRLDLEH